MEWIFSGQTLFFRASASCSKFWRIKNTFNTMNSGQATSCQKSWKIKNISIQWKIPRQILFFGASTGCSKFWRIKNTFNTVNSGHTLFSGQAQVAQISWKIKNISIQWKIPGQILFFRASAGCSKFWMTKIYTLCFSGQATSCSKVLKDKKYFKAVKSFRATLFFRARKLFKNLNDKKSVTGRQGRQGREFLP